MPTSEVEIANSALAKLGSQRITTLDDNNERARVMKEQYTKVRDELLYMHPWNFAIGRSELTALVSPVPEFQWTYYYQLPADCIRVVGTDLYPPSEWAVEGRYLASHYPTIKIKYIKKVADVSKFTPGFAELLALKLAADTAFSITQSTSLRDSLLQQFDKQIRQVRSFNGQEGEGARVYADTWLNSRR